MDSSVEGPTQDCDHAIASGYPVLNTTRRRLQCRVIIACSCLLILLAEGCSNRQPTPAAPKPVTKSFRIGLGPWIGFGPFYLARDKGFFKQAGVDVELTVITGVSERNSALKANRIDGLAAPVDYFALSAGNGLPNTIVLAVDESVGGDGIVAKPSITKFQDLRGKKVAFQRGLPSEFFFRALLQKNGVDINSIQTVDMETADAGAAFLAGKLDAACVWEPWLSKAKDAGKGHILASTREYPNLILDTLAFNQQVVRDSPDGVQKIVDAVLKAIDYWTAHPEESNKIMAHYFEVSPEKYAAILSGARFCDLKRNKAVFGEPGSLGPIYDIGARASSIWQSAGVMKSGVDPKTIIDGRFIGQAH